MHVSQKYHIHITQQRLMSMA